MSEEDVDAYLSQVVCLRLKSSLELQQIQLPLLSSRAVQLGSLYVRGLGHLLGANNASGCPLPSAALMPWHGFDGQLFHSKYLLAHRGVEKTELLDNNPSCLSQFLQLKEKLVETCRTRGRVLQSRPRVPQTYLNPLPGGRYRDKHSGFPQSADEDWRRSGETAGGHRHRQGWRERGEDRREMFQNDFESRERMWGRGGHRGGAQIFYSSSHTFCEDLRRPPKQSRGPHNRGRSKLAPRWSHPSAP